MWYKTTDVVPPDKTMIEVFHKGEQFRLWFDSGLFFLEDKSMYIYYLPEYWRSL